MVLHHLEVCRLSCLCRLHCGPTAARLLQSNSDAAATHYIHADGLCSSQLLHADLLSGGLIRVNDLFDHVFRFAHFRFRVPHNQDMVIVGVVTDQQRIGIVLVPTAPDQYLAPRVLFQSLLISSLWPDDQPNEVRGRIWGKKDLVTVRVEFKGRC